MSWTSLCHSDLTERTQGVEDGDMEQTGHPVNTENEAVGSEDGDDVVESFMEKEEENATAPTPIEGAWNVTNSEFEEELESHELDAFETTVHPDYEYDDTEYEYGPFDYDYYNYTTYDHDPILYAGKLSFPDSGSSPSTNSNETSREDEISRYINGISEETGEILKEDHLHEKNNQNYTLSLTEEESTPNAQFTIEISDLTETSTSIYREMKGSNSDNPRDIKGGDQSTISESYFDYYEEYDYLPIENETDVDYDFSYFPEPLTNITSTVISDREIERTQINQSSAELDSLPTPTTDLFNISDSLQTEEDSLEEQKSKLEEEKNRLDKNKRILNPITRLASEIEAIGTFLLFMEEKDLNKSRSELDLKDKALEREEEFIAESELEMEGSGDVDETVAINLNEIVDDIERRRDELSGERRELEEKEDALSGNEEMLEIGRDKIAVELDEIESNVTKIEEIERKIEDKLINVKNQKLDEEIDQLDAKKGQIINLEAKLDNKTEEVDHLVIALDSKEEDIFTQEKIIDDHRVDVDHAEDHLIEDRNQLSEKEKQLEQEQKELEEEKKDLIEKEEKLKEGEEKTEEDIENIEKEKDSIIDKEIAIVIAEHELNEKEEDLQSRENEITEKEEDLEMAIIDFGDKKQQLGAQLDIIENAEDKLEQDRKELEQDEQLLKEEGLILAKQEEEVIEILEEVNAEEDDLVSRQREYEEALLEAKQEEDVLSILEEGIKDRNESLHLEETILLEREQELSTERNLVDAENKTLRADFDRIDSNEQDLLSRRAEVHEMEKELEQKREEEREIETKIIAEEKQIEKEEGELVKIDELLENSTDSTPSANITLSPLFELEVEGSGEADDVFMIDADSSFFDAKESDKEFDSTEQTDSGQAKHHLKDVVISLTTDESALETFDDTIEFGKSLEQTENFSNESMEFDLDLVDSSGIMPDLFTRSPKELNFDSEINLVTEIPEDIGLQTDSGFETDVSSDLNPDFYTGSPEESTIHTDEDFVTDASPYFIPDILTGSPKDFKLHPNSANGYSNFESTTTGSLSIGTDSRESSSDFPQSSFTEGVTSQDVESSTSATLFAERVPPISTSDSEERFTKNKEERYESSENTFDSKYDYFPNPYPDYDQDNGQDYFPETDTGYYPDGESDYFPDAVVPLVTTFPSVSSEISDSPSETDLRGEKIPSAPFDELDKSEGDDDSSLVSPTSISDSIPSLSSEPTSHPGMVAVTKAGINLLNRGSNFVGA